MDTNSISRLNLSMTVSYSSLEEATDAEKSYAKANGYCLNIRRTQRIGNKADGMVKHRILQCVHSGKPTSQANVRSTCTLRQDCPFLLRISKDDESGNSWSANIINAEHNHEAVDNIAAYSSARCLTEAEVETVHKLSSIGAKPRIVIGALNQQNSSNLSTRQDIYNIKKLKKRKLLDGRSEIEALLDILLMQDVQHAYRRDQDGNLTCLFINPKRAEIIMKNLSANKVFLLDSTYKTSQYKMPLLHGTGVTATNETFTIFFCFMRQETQEFYTWAMCELKKCFVAQNVFVEESVFVTDREISLMNAITAVFPNSTALLCLWHINKNILAKQRGSFITEEAWQEFMGLWQSLINSASHITYGERLEQLRQNISMTVYSYLLTTWLCHKERFVLAWTRNARHFGHTTTSRVESAHAALKKWLQVSTGDMLGVCLLLERACDDQERTLSQTNYFQRTHNLVEYSQLFWRDVKKSISRHALKLARMEYHKSLVPEDEQCSNTFTPTMGIPCSHRLRRMLADPISILSIHDFDQHWWLIRQESLPLIQPDEVLDTRNVLLEIEQRLGNVLPHQQQLLLRSLVNVARQDLEVRNPLIVQTRGRPTGSTRRNPSAFEYAEQIQQHPIQPQRIRSCGICNTVGHNSSTCPLRDDATISIAQQISAPPFGQ